MFLYQNTFFIKETVKVVKVLNDVIQYVYNLETELANSIGFCVPDINVKYNEDSETTSWLYKDKQIIIPQNITSISESNKAEIDFSIAHEFCHMIQNFVFELNNNTNAITVEDYESCLQHFFDTTNIYINKNMFDKFQTFINESPFQNLEMLKVMMFDDEFYVSASKINEYIINPWLYSTIYTGNTTELHANAFAAEKIMIKYEQEKVPANLFKDLKTKIQEHQKTFPLKTDKRTKESFENQIKIKRIIDNFENEKLPFFKRFILNINNITKQRKITKMLMFKNYDFEIAQKYIIKQIEKVEKIIEDINQNHKTTDDIIKENKRLETTIEELKNYKIKNNKTGIITIIELNDNFAPLEQDKDKFVCYQFKYSTPPEIVRQVELNINNYTKELVVDVRNQTLYNYHTKRTLPMIEADKTLNTDKMQSSETKENKTLFHNDIDTNER